MHKTQFAGACLLFGGALLTACGGGSSTTRETPAEVPEVMVSAVEADLTARDVHDQSTGITVSALEITGWTTISGRLDGGDTAGPEGHLSDHYVFEAAPGAAYAVRLQSEEFDTFLVVSPSTQDAVVNDDVSGTDLNSGLTIEPRLGGECVVVVSGYDTASMGKYDLRIEPVRFGARAARATGARYSEALEVTDPVLASGRRVDRFAVEVAEGEDFEVGVESMDFDTTVEAVSPEGHVFYNDDAPGRGTNSTVQIMNATGGVWHVNVSSFSAAATGAYQLAVGASPATSEPKQVTGLAVGQPAQGHLAPGDATLNSGEFVDTYSFQGSAGQQIRIRLESSDFDPYVMLRGNNVTQDNDDAADGSLNSEIRYTLPTDGQYNVSVTSYQAGETGSYTLLLDSVGQHATSVHMLSNGAQVRSNFEAADPRRMNGQTYESYQFQGTPGTQVTVEMSSTSVDTWLSLRGPDGGGDENDDIASGNTNSRIVFPITRAGTYEIVASTYGRDDFGEYTISLNVTQGGGLPTSIANTAPIATGGTSIAVGQSSGGRLQQGDTTLQSGEFVDAWTLSTVAGQEVTLAATSTEFDTWLEVRGPNDFSASNDDGIPGTTNARLSFVAATGGDYTVAVTSYEPGMTGAYVLAATAGLEGPMQAPTGSQVSAAGGRIFAIVAGITDYADQPDLAYCAEDATKLRESLRGTGLLAEQSVTLINSQATRANLQAAFSQVGQVIGPNDVFIFFYSGHGGRLDSGDANEPDGRDETLYLYDGHVTDDEVRAWFDGIGARVEVIALDSCFSGGFARDVVSASNRVGIFSSEEDVVSSVASRFQAGGYMAHFLRTGFDGVADSEPSDGTITVGEMTQHLRRQWAQHMQNEHVETDDNEMTYQNLVIERVAKVSEPLTWRPSGQ